MADQILTLPEIRALRAIIESFDLSMLTGPDGQMLPLNQITHPAAKACILTAKCTENWEYRYLPVTDEHIEMVGKIGERAQMQDNPMAGVLPSDKDASPNTKKFWKRTKVLVGTTWHYTLINRQDQILKYLKAEAMLHRKIEMTPAALMDKDEKTKRVKDAIRKLTVEQGGMTA